MRSVQLTWQQNSSSSTSGRKRQAGLEEQRGVWSLSERKVIAAMEDYLERCTDIRVEIDMLKRTKLEVFEDVDQILGRPAQPSLISREILVEVEHVKAHRTEEDKKDMSHFERLVTDGNVKADDRAKEVRCGMKDSWHR